MSANVLDSRAKLTKVGHIVCVLNLIITSQTAAGLVIKI